MRLWVGQTISQFGSQVGGTALGFTAILVLSATSVQLGILSAAGAAPVLVVGLLAGVWVDRLRRRPILIAADIGRALLLASIPLAALLGVLRIEQLYLVAALVAVLAVFFDVAYQAVLPALVLRDQLVEGNSKLGMSESLAEIVGPGVGGALVQAVSAPLAILIDALSFLCSAASLWMIRAVEVAPERPAQRQSVSRDIAAGLRVVLGDRLLRALLGSAVTMSLAGGIIGSLYSLYALRELGMAPAVVGVVIGVGGVGALGGALLAERAVRRFGLGATLTVGLALGTGLQVLIPLAHGPLALPMMIAPQLFGDIGLAVYFINERSLRQALIPDRMLGRANASWHFLTAGGAPIGALLGGVLGQAIGLRAAIAVGVAGVMLASLWVLCSPVRRLRELPG